MSLSLANIRDAIDIGDVQLFVGEFEGQHLDAKSQPYHFAGGNDVRREFAKDVAAFANGAGGCIIVGAETAVSTLQAGEQITALKPFPKTHFDEDQYGKLIAEWLYPQPAGVRISWHEDDTTAGYGIGTILIPEQERATKPFLLTRTIGDKKSTETLLGYVERHLDRTDIKSVVELHHALRTGMNLAGTILARFDSLEARIDQYFTASSPTGETTPPPSTS